MGGLCTEKNEEETGMALDVRMAEKNKMEVNTRENMVKKECEFKICFQVMRQEYNLKDA